MPRAVALDLLTAVLAQKRPLDDALESHPGMANLDPRDRAFARNLAATTLRRLGEIDTVIGAFLDTPLTGKGRPVQDLLRLGLCQLLYLETPPHAAVATAVDLAQARGLGPYKKLVNAILRRATREGAALIAGLDSPRLNTPSWLWESWRAAYGEATARAIAAAHLIEAPLDLSVKTEPENWAETLGARRLPTDSLRLDRHRGRVADLPGFAEGAWWVQDAAAALPVRLLGPVAGKTVLDLCAAPGGKTAQLTAAGARTVALDRSKNRINRLNQNLARLKLDARTIVGDAQSWRPSDPADAVLLDAPCSSTGTIRRHPDIAHLKSPDDVRKTAALQHRLLEAAIDMVKPGGRIVYCVCSLQPEEGPTRIARLIEDGAPVVPVPIDPGEVGGFGRTCDHGAVRTLPGDNPPDGGLDGFYIARLERR